MFASLFYLLNILGILVLLPFPPLKADTRKLNLDTVNKRTVGLSLRANGKQYYISAELCPGGIFLTKKINEHCLCYNGLFETVRECCGTNSTKMSTDSLEWKLDYKCGSTVSPNDLPIKAILPLQKPHSRYSTIIIPRSFSGSNVTDWKKFDAEDIIIKNMKRLTLHKETEFDIIHVKPLGIQIRIRFGPQTNTVVCYKGWMSDNMFQRIRVKIKTPVEGHVPNCCFNITKENTPGEITSDCTSGVIATKFVDVPLADVDTGKCPEVVHNLKAHHLRKRNAETFSSVTSGNRKPLLVKRQIPMQPVKNLEDVSSVGSQHSQTRPSAPSVILPRKRGISKMNLRDQAEAIIEFIAILRNDPNVELREPETFRFKMLKKSMDIFLKVIPNSLVPHVMLKTAFDVFYFLYEELDPWLTKAPEIFTKTMESLGSCEEIEKRINFTTEGCPEELDQVVIDPIVQTKLETLYAGKPEELERVKESLKHVEIRKDKRFIPEVFDIYIEINWKVVDFVHSFCFEHFSRDFSAHSFFETELEKLFILPEVQKRWFSNVPSLRYVRGIFPTSNLPVRMKQLDKVSTVGHYLSRYNGSYWLHRPNRGSIPWFYDIYADPTDPKLQIQEMESGPRLAFSQNMIEEDNRYSSGEVKLAGRSMTSVNYAERHPIHPFIFPERFPPRKLIWDGMAVCLHATFSNKRRYFLDSELWGMNPSFQRLDTLYS